MLTSEELHGTFVLKGVLKPHVCVLMCQISRF